MPASAEFIGFLKEQMAGFGAVTHKRMFGGAGLYRDARIFALVVDDQLYFKSDAGNRARFEAEGLKPFGYATKTGERVLTSYMRAPEACLDDPDEMARWCRIAWGAALRAAKPVPKLQPLDKKPRRRQS